MAEGLRPSPENLPSDGSLIRRERINDDDGRKIHRMAGAELVHRRMGRQSQWSRKSPIPARASCIGASRFITCGDADERVLSSPSRQPRNHLRPRPGGRSRFQWPNVGAPLSVRTGALPNSAPLAHRVFAFGDIGAAPQVDDARLVQAKLRVSPQAHFGLAALQGEPVGPVGATLAEGLEERPPPSACLFGGLVRRPLRPFAVSFPMMQITLVLSAERVFPAGLVPFRP